MPSDLSWSPGTTPALGGVGLTCLPVDGGEEFILMPYSWPRYWWVPSRPLSRDELETWHLGQLLSDLTAGTGQNLGVHGGVKGERPDFTVFGDADHGTSLGVELASFTVGARRAIERDLAATREALDADPQRFSHLAGCHVFVLDLIGDENRRSRSAVREPAALLAALERLERPRSQGPDEVATGFPDQMPADLFAVGEVEDGLKLSCHEIVAHGVAINDPGYRVPRIHPQFQVQMTRTEIRTEFVRIVDQHNYGIAETLVIVAGGPDRHGAGYFEDEALLRQVINGTDDPELAFAPRTGEVLVHWWSDGTIDRLFPRGERVADAVPAHLRPITMVTHGADEPDAEPRALVCVRPGAEVTRIR